MTSDNSALWFRQFGAPLDVLTLETAPLPLLAAGKIRIQTLAAPVNPSDLIPITGAYRHRVQPPRVAGYEGVGRIIEVGSAVTSSLAPYPVGQRVLPLRSDGTWQRYIDCEPTWLVPVPDKIDNTLAAQAYINPLTAHLMLQRWPVRGKRIVLTAASSSFALLFAQWAKSAGASEIFGVIRSPKHYDALAHLGITPIVAPDGQNLSNNNELNSLLYKADAVFDAVGGTLAEHILARLNPQAHFISYGLLSGKAFPHSNHGAQLQRFHLREATRNVEISQWQSWFQALWSPLSETQLPSTTSIPFHNWRDALTLFTEAQRKTKPILDFSHKKLLNK